MLPAENGRRMATIHRLGHDRAEHWAAKHWAAKTQVDFHRMTELDLMRNKFFLGRRDEQTTRRRSDACHTDA